MKIIKRATFFDRQNRAVEQGKASAEKITTKEKSKFVLDILDYAVKKKVDSSMQDRILKLVSEEVGKTSDSDREIFVRLESIENALKNIDKLEIGRNVLPEKETFHGNVDQEASKGLHSDGNTVMFHNPLFISAYLNKFKENTDLKWATHPWDEKKYTTIEDFIQALNESKEYSMLFHYNRSLYNLIRYFVYQPKVEIENGIPKYGWPNFPGLKIGWQFPNNILVEWCKLKFNNKTEGEIKYPFSFPLPSELQPHSPIKGKIIKTFENVVDIFKTEIQFRENYFLIELKKRRNKLTDYQFSGIEKFSNLEFYTYTSGVLAALDIILNGIRKNETEKEISFDYQIIDKVLIIDITHKNSFPSNRLLDTQNPSQFLGGGLNAIAENLFSLCDFSIISKFSDYSHNEVIGELCITYEGTEGVAKGKNVSLKTPPKFNLYNSEVSGFTYRLKFPL